jgi:hypothetical protein
MCASTPKTPKVQDIPIRQPVLLPDNGDPAVRGALRGTRRLTTSAMIFAGRNGSLGMPATSGPLGTSGL